MKKLFILAILLFPLFNASGQGIGEMAPEKDPINFPPRTLGIDIMFGEGGFGLGGFYRHLVAGDLTFFTDFSISSEKDQNEFDYIDPYTGESITYGKKNRVFLMPLFGGLQYRMFSSSLGDNLRPYINAALGPTMVMTTPYDKEFFSAFGKAQVLYTPGGYIGIGANFGLDTKNVVGINLRYYYIHFFNQGVESLEGRFLTDLGGFYITINLGSMY